MSIKDDLAPDQWEKIAQAPFVAGFAVSAADPSGLIGAFQESSAMANSMQSSEEATIEGTLIHHIVEELRTSEGRRRIKDGLKEIIQGRDPADASEAALLQLGATMKLVAEHTPNEFRSLADLVKSTAEKVAAAAKEGGFMGFGGVTISDAERKTLSDIESVLAATVPVG